MKRRILVPVDYTPASANSLQYARSFCKETDTEMIVLHVESIPEKNEEKHMVKTLLADREKQLTEFACNCLGNKKVDQGVKIKYLIRQGRIVGEIAATAIDEEVDLIIIGIREKHSLAERMLGSVCTLLEKQAHTPMLIIPEGATYQPINKIAFPNDINFTNKKIRTYMLKLADYFGAKIESLFIVPAVENAGNEREEIIDTGWMSTGGHDFGKMLVVRDKTFQAGLDYYVENHLPEVVALYVSHREGVRNLMHKSLAEKVTSHMVVPLLVFREDDVNN